MCLLSFHLLDPIGGRIKQQYRTLQIANTFSGIEISRIPNDIKGYVYRMIFVKIFCLNLPDRADSPRS